MFAKIDGKIYKTVCECGYRIETPIINFWMNSTVHHRKICQKNALSIIKVGEQKTSALEKIKITK